MDTPLTLEHPEPDASVTAGRVGSSALSGRILFVWAKDSRIACFSSDEIRGKEDTMKRDGWAHTATIDPARWIEHMANGDDDPSDMLEELQFLPNTQDEPRGNNAPTNPLTHARVGSGWVVRFSR